MSKLKRLRKKANYEDDVPRCATCIHASRRQTELKNSMPVRTYFICRAMQFEIQRNAVCDRWKNKKGDTLEP